MSRLALLVAMAENNAIGIENRLPWRCPEDLKHFKALTMGHTLIMGRKTFDSIGKPLPGRNTIVVTRNVNLQIEGCQMAHSLAQAMTLAAADELVFVVGGAEIYAQTLPLADVLYITQIKQEVTGDAFFPSFSQNEWQETAREAHSQQTPQVLAFDFVTYQCRGVLKAR
jgi:dihydrofolate reductase